MALTSLHARSSSSAKHSRHQSCLCTTSVCYPSSLQSLSPLVALSAVTTFTSASPSILLPVPPSLPPISFLFRSLTPYLPVLSLARARARSLSLSYDAGGEACLRTGDILFDTPYVPHTPNPPFFSWSFLLLPTTCRPCGRNRWLKTQRKQGHLSRLSDA